MNYDTIISYIQQAHPTDYYLLLKMREIAFYGNLELEALKAELQRERKLGFASSYEEWQDLAYSPTDYTEADEWFRASEEIREAFGYKPLTEEEAIAWHDEANQAFFDSEEIYSRATHYRLAA